jgi:heptaprenylglyceryl phosphate synthase
MPNLCAAIDHLVEQRLRRALKTGETITVPDLASEITESLADLIVTGALPEEQPRLIDYVVSEPLRHGEATGR